jgi:hypothetical protein
MLFCNPTNAISGMRQVGAGYEYIDALKKRIK